LAVDILVEKSMTRQRDEEALQVARDIAESIYASPEAKQTGILIGARAYRRGRNEAATEIAELEARLDVAERGANEARMTLNLVGARTHGRMSWLERRAVRQRSKRSEAWKVRRTARRAARL
jgi:hypothetical protein